MPHPVRPERRDSRVKTSALDHVVNQVGADRLARGPTGEEHQPGAFLTAALAEVGAERFADLTGQRQPVLPAALAAHGQFPAPPVHIVEPEPGHLDRAQPESGDQQHDRPFRAPCRQAGSQLSITAATSAGLIKTGMVASRQPPTGGTAVPSRSESSWRR